MEIACPRFGCARIATQVAAEEALHHDHAELRRDLAEALEADGAKVAKSQIVLDKPIKAIGLTQVKVQLHPEVAVTIKVNVARSPEEADLQSQGVDVMAQMFERDEAGFTEAYDPNAEPGDTARPAAPAAEPAEA